VNQFLFDLGWVESMRAEESTWFFKLMSWFGYTTFYMIFLSVGYWLWSYRAFTRLALMIAISTLVNAYLKDFWQDPRPIYPASLDDKVADSFGMPSGHAQIAATLWFWLCLEMRRLWLWLLGLTMVFLISLSRLYLAVHDMQDILVGLGLAFGLIIAFSALPLRTYVSSRRPLRWEPLIGLILFQAILIYTWPSTDGPGEIAGLGGFALTFLIGVELARRAGCRRPEDIIVGPALITVCGLVGLFALYAGVTRLADTAGSNADLVSYAGTALIGFYISFVPPYVFKRFAKHEPPVDEAVT